MKRLFLVLIMLPLITIGQSRKQKKAIAAQQKENQQVIARLKQHNDSLQTLTERGYKPNAIADYISRQFQLAGLIPFGTTDMVVNSFSTVSGHPDPSTYFKVNGKELVLNKDYFPLPFSAARQISGMPAMALHEKNLPWFADLKDLADEKNLIDSQLYNLIADEAARAAGKGASAFLVYNTSNNNNPAYNTSLHLAESAIPVIFITPEGLQKYFPDHADLLDIELNVLLIKEQKRTYWNVQAYLNNAAANTVTISATYGKDDPSVANSFCEAAMIIEFVKMIAYSKAKNNNYLLLVSEIPAEHSRLTNRNYDLVLNKICLTNENNQLLVRGIETSYLWKSIISEAPQNIFIRLDSTLFRESGYLLAQQIPVLVFASENKTCESINYDMEVSALNFMKQIAEAADNKGKMEYSSVQTPLPAKAEEIVSPARVGEKPMNPIRTSVSFGVIPDDKYSGVGLKIRGLTPKKTGAKIGLQPGDILLKLGDNTISNMNTYLQALSPFNIGDTTQLTIKRNNEDKVFTVIF